MQSTWKGSVVFVAVAAAFALGRASLGQDGKEAPAPPATVKALRYRITIYDSALEMTHRAGEEVDELWFPDRKVVANVRTGPVTEDFRCFPVMHAFEGEIRNRQYDPVLATSIDLPTQEVQVVRELADRIFELADVTKRQRALAEDTARRGVDANAFRWKPLWRSRTEGGEDK